MRRLESTGSAVTLSVVIRPSRHILMPLLGVAVFAVLWAAQWGWVVLNLESPRIAVALDINAYMKATERFLAGGPFYPPEQLAGPYGEDSFPILYPPQTIVLFAPFTVLPMVLWWAIPLTVVTAVVVYHRPRPIVWPILAALLWWPHTTDKVILGNPSLWLTMFLALGTIWRPWSALVIWKPTVAPFALIGVRDWRWWVVAVLALLPFCWLVPDWITSTRNFRSPEGFLYSLFEVPMYSIPLVAWLGSSRRLQARRDRRTSVSQEPPNGTTADTTSERAGAEARP